MKKVTNMGHQGDVFFTRLGDIGEVDISNLETLKRDEEGTLTLVQGEATHHHHLFPAEAKVDAYISGEKDGIKKFTVVIKEKTELQHFNVSTKKLTKEHDNIVFFPGVYQFNTQRQTNWENEVVRVLD